VSGAGRVRTVLFVDDDDDVTRGLALALRRERFRTLTTSSPEEALRIVECETVDVIVSDDQMPNISGSELLARVRAAHPDIVRILLTGQTDIRRAASAVNEAGVFRFLLKPYDRTLLVETLHMAFASAESLYTRDRFENARVFDGALERLWLAHQPIFGRDGRVVGFELLMRSSCPEFRSPEHVIALAKVLDRGIELDRSIGRRAASVAEALRDRLLFVNVDPPSVWRDELFAPLLPHAHHVVLEITERDARGDAAKMATRILELKKLGFMVAVDDLGAGHAGLNAVVELMPDIVKLDMTLIRDVDQSYVKRRLVRSVCEAARDLGIRVVAEGVERIEELDTTFDAGCDYFQGYLLGRPCREPAYGTWPRAAPRVPPHLSSTDPATDPPRAASEAPPDAHARAAPDFAPSAS